MRFERAFHLFLYATAFWAFLALVSTGQLHLPAVVVALPLLTLPMFGAARRAQFPPAGWTFLTVLAFAAAFLNMLVMREVMYSLVYFFLFLEITKLWTLRQNRDVFQVLILSFFQMVAASVMTASISFAVLFIGYMFLVTVTWMLFSIKREADGVDRGEWVRRRWFRKEKRPEVVPVLNEPENGVRGARQTPFLNWSFLYGSVWMTLVLIVGTAGVFMLIPRFSSQRFLSGFQMMRPQKISGFTDQVDFENFGAIQQDSTIIGRVKLFQRRGAGVTSQGFLRLRATSLDSYTGTRWRKGRMAQSMQVPYSAMDFTIRESAPTGQYLLQDIYLEPDGSSYFFGATMPVRFRFSRPISLTFDQYNFSVVAARGRDASIRYEVQSLLPTEAKDLAAEAKAANAAAHEQATARLADSAREIWNTGRDLLRVAVQSATSEDRPPQRRRTGDGRWRGEPPDALSARVNRVLRAVRQHLDPPGAHRASLRLSADLREVFTQLPDVADMNSVRALAREWTRTSRLPLDQARRIEHVLQTRFAYSTDIQVSNPDLHMTEFLTVTKRGHCEYHASAMTLMLRCLGVPARIVTGYFTDDYNEAGGYFMVRRSHAHSWVEAWIEPHGWVTFDPTPPSGVGMQRDGETGVLAGVKRYLDAVRFYWYRHVIDFDLQDQYQMARAAAAWRMRLSTGLDRFLSPLRMGERAVSLRAKGISPGRAALLALCLAVGAVVVFLLGREVFGLFARKLLRRGDGAKGVAVHRQVAYYIEILQTLSALNFRRRGGQTPWEFAREVVAARGDWADLIPVTEAYYHARFRSGEVTPRDLERARGLIERMRGGQG